MKDRLAYVTWYTCNCQWVSKYCDENHKAGASIPVSILEQYREAE